MTSDLNEESEELRALVGSKPNAAATRLVETALESKWEGIQSIALQVLGSWGDSYAVEKLRSFLADAEKLKFGWSIRGVAIRELSRCVGPSDVDWVLDHYFALNGVIAKHEFLRVVLALPPDAARLRLQAQCGSDDRDNRQAAMKALGNLSFPDRRALLEPFLNDSDSEIRKGAKYLYNQS